jgi:hypothetical protein
MTSYMQNCYVLRTKQRFVQIDWTLKLELKLLHMIISLSLYGAIFYGTHRTWRKADVIHRRLELIEFDLLIWNCFNEIMWVWRWKSQLKLLSSVVKQLGKLHFQFDVNLKFDYCSRYACKCWLSQGIINTDSWSGICLQKDLLHCGFRATHFDEFQR